MRVNYGRTMSLFRKFDLNGDGQLSIDEFLQGVRSLDLPASREEIEVGGVACM
jgi:Ca2+-binding EF-hand superfamily protein